MPVFDMPVFETMLETLRARDPLPPLFPDAAWQPELSRRIIAASDDEMFGPNAQNSVSQNSRPQDGGPDALPAACRAGLLLWNDDLEASHALSQNIEDATGSFWHAIMHRREGDAANSNYWWRKVGAHPACGDVHRAVLAALENEGDGCGKARDFAALLRRAGVWQPEAFVQHCEAARHDRSDDTWLRRVQSAEMEALLLWCRARTG